MNEVLFSHPEWLWPAALATAAALLLLAGSQILARRRLHRLLGPGQPSGAAMLASDVALALALILLSVALVGPKIARQYERGAASGADVVILIDVSRSMDAADNPPSRLDHARRTSAGLLRALDPADRVALAVYAGRGVLLTPLTPDRTALAEMLPVLESGLIRPGGSRLPLGIAAALRAFEQGSDRPRSLVLLSDGEITSRPDEHALADLRRHSVRLVAGALGGHAGVEIPDWGVPLRDQHGRIVRSRRVLPPLQRLADGSGGELHLADERGDLNLEGMVAAIDREQRSATAGQSERRVDGPVVLPLAALAFALLAFEAIARRPARRSSARRVPRALGRSALLWVAVAALLGAGGPRTLETVARTRALSGHELVELGVLRAGAEDLEGASHAFRAAALQPGRSSAAIATYDLGVLALQRGALEEARDFFFDALTLAPNDFKTRFNLEWTLVALAQQPTSGVGETHETARSPAAAQPSEEPSGGAESAPAEAAAAVDSAMRPEPKRLSASERQGWLARIQDDPARALRSVVHGGGSESGRRRRPRTDEPRW